MKIRTRSLGGIEKTEDDKFTWWFTFEIEGEDASINLKSKDDEPYSVREDALKDLRNCAILTERKVLEKLGSENVILNNTIKDEN